MPIPTILSSVTLGELSSALSQSDLFLGVLTGYLAEAKLKSILQDHEGVEDLEKIPDHSLQRGDFKLSYRGKLVTVEAKTISLDGLRTNLEGNTSWRGYCRNTARVNGKCLPYTVGDYDILAVSLFSATQTWEFAYFTSSELQILSKNAGKFPQKIRLNSNHFSTKRTLDEVLCLATH